MSNAIALAADGDPVLPGQIRFAQAALPPLPAGRYRLSATQTVNGIKDQDTPPQYGVVQPLQIQGPRFALAPGDLQMVTPPANQNGDWENVLPNVVLRRRTLPWERTLDGTVPPAGVVPAPWMGLITVTAAEIGGEAGAITAPSPVRTGTVAELVQTVDPSILGPDLGSSVSQADRATQLLLLDLDAGLFQSVAPALADLPFLAHVREVNTGNKEILGLDEDGVFSVIIGNRTLQPGAVNYMFLVSLEGQQGHLAGCTLPTGAKTIRFASLAWWKVEATAAQGDFIALMQALPGQGGVDLVQLPAVPISGPGTPAQMAAMGIGMGYVPLLYRMRAGEQATAWYRGPASAVPTKADGLGPFVFSDQAIRYDPATALFDVSQAAAWQIGRLLALSDGSFARQMFEWRKAHHQAVAASVGLDATLRSLPPAGRALQTSVVGAKPATGVLAQGHLAVAAALADAFGTGDAAIPQRIRREDRPVAAVGLRAAAADGQDPLDSLLDHVFGAGA
jgi:hypothetical protein